MIEVIKAGLMTSIQDLGRQGFEAYGIPNAGVLDSCAAIRANLLVGNSKNKAVLEITLIGPTLLFSTTCQIAISGAECECFINDNRIRTEKVYTMYKQDVLKIKKVNQGCRAYLAFGGEMNIPSQLNSKSTYAYANIGGLNGDYLKAGDKIPINVKIRPERNHFEYQLNDTIQNKNIIYILKAPEYNSFSATQIIAFEKNFYTLSPSSNRMGFRFEGKNIDMNNIKPIISSPLFKGVIQMPPNGLPILSMHDGGTIGGYPRIGIVKEDELCKIAQLKPNEKIKFKFLD